MKVSRHVGIASAALAAIALLIGGATPALAAPGRTVSAAAVCPSPGQKLGNPGFENGSAPWRATPNVIGSFLGQTAHGGSRFAWLDGRGRPHADVLLQSVTLPAGCARYALSFFLHVDTEETSATEQFDRLTVQVDTRVIATFSNLDHATGYTQHSFDVSADGGRTVALLFIGIEDESLQTSFVVDDTALNVS